MFYVTCDMTLLQKLHITYILLFRLHFHRYIIMFNKSNINYMISRNIICTNKHWFKTYLRECTEHLYEKYNTLNNYINEILTHIFLRNITFNNYIRIY